MQVAVDRQQPTIDPGRAAVAVVPRKHQPTGTGLDQAALVDPLRGGRVPGHAQGVVSAILLAGSRRQAIFPAAILEGLLPGLAFRGILGLALHQGLVGDTVAPDIALPAPQVDVELPQQLPGAVQRPIQVRHAPAHQVARSLGRRAIELARGGQQHLQGLLVVQVGITLHHQGQGPGGVGRGHRGAVVGGITATRHGTADRRARGGQAPVLGDAALVVFLLVVLVQARHRQPVAFQLRLEVRQRRAHAGVGITAVAGAEHVDHAATRHVAGGVEPGVLLEMLGIGRTQITQGLVADILGLAAPAVVDGPHPGIHQGTVDRLEIPWIGVGAEQQLVVLVGVAHIHLGIEGHAMHAHAIPGRAHGAGDMGAVAVVGAIEHPGHAERGAIQILAGGGNRVKTSGTGLGVGGIEPRVQGTDADPGAGDPGGVGLARLHALQAPILPVFGRAPTGGVAQAASLLIGRHGRQRQRGGERQAQGACQRLELITSHIHVDDFSCFCCRTARSGSIGVSLHCLAASPRPYRAGGGRPPLDCDLDFRRKPSSSR